MRYGRAVFIAVDQLVNAICAGWPDEICYILSYSEERRGNS